MGRPVVLNSSGQAVYKFGDVSRETLDRLADLCGPGPEVATCTKPHCTVDDSGHLDATCGRQPANPVDVIQRHGCGWISAAAEASRGSLRLSCLPEEPDAHVHMIESNQRKAAFLRTALRETGSPGTVHPGRIESVAKNGVHGPVDAVSARALASLEQLFRLVRALHSGRRCEGRFPQRSGFSERS